VQPQLLGVQVEAGDVDSRHRPVPQLHVDARLRHVDGRLNASGGVPLLCGRGQHRERVLHRAGDPRRRDRSDLVPCPGDPALDGGDSVPLLQAYGLD
jgi:hypothetical protein